VIGTKSWWEAVIAWIVLRSRGPVGYRSEEHSAGRADRAAARLHPIAPDPPPELLTAIFILREFAALAQQATEKGDKETLALLRSVITDTLQLPAVLVVPIEQLGEIAAITGLAQKRRCRVRVEHQARPCSCTV
jgi:hypothetical protein